MSNPFTDARPNLFLSAFFRSGSSHVKGTLLRLLPHYSPATTVFSAGMIGGENCDINIFGAQILFMNGEKVFHQHTHGTDGNVAMLKQYGFRPIVQFRNMLDSMVSVGELLSTGQPQGLGIYYPDNWMKMGEHTKLWWLTKNLPNWYFTFYLSWMHADIEILPIWYDIHYQDQVAGIRKILDFTGLSMLGNVSDDVIHEAAQTVDVTSRKKFGRPGRGKEILSVEMIDDIKNQAMCWGTVGAELIQELIDR